MKIDIVSSVFSPEPIISARTSADLAQQLARNGHRVRVFTAFPNRPAGKIFEGYRRRPWVRDESFADFQVYRLFSFFSSDSRVSSRFLENLSFGIASTLALMFLDKPDVIYANTWPIFAQGLLALVCWLRCVPLILSVQDIYPESLSIQSRIGSARGGLFRFLRWIDQKTKQNSAGIVVISEKFKRIYVKNRRVPAEKLHVIPNWIDEQQVEINPELNHVRCSHNIPDDAFLVMYAGNVSAASGLDTVIKAFQNLEAEPRIYLLVAGSGSKLLEWRALAQKIANPRILFHTPWLDSETSGMLAAADLFMLPTYGDQSLVSVPSKLITYMLAARPILCCAADNSDIARTVGHAACGWTIPVGNPNLVAQMLITLSQEPADELRRFGRQGRNYALRHMTRGANLPRLVNLIQSVEQRRPFHPERLADKGDVL